VTDRSVQRNERAALCDTLASADPDAPTLCEGWVTTDLAAHLLVRERNPLALPGIVAGGPFAAITRRLMGRAARRGYSAVIDRLRAGPPPWNQVGPMSTVNLVEDFVHHEDVRRAAGAGPRPPDPARDDALWRGLRAAARLQGRRVRGAGLEVATPDARRRTVRRGEPRATLTGPPGELVLYLNGRTSVAEVELDGPPEAVDAVRSARFGV